MEDLIRCGKFQIPVLYCDNQVLVVVKPCNIPVQADSSGDMDLLTALKKYVGERFNKTGRRRDGICAYEQGGTAFERCLCGA